MPKHAMVPAPPQAPRRAACRAAALALVSLVLLVQGAAAARALQAPADEPLQQGAPAADSDPVPAPAPAPGVEVGRGAALLTYTNPVEHPWTIDNTAGLNVKLGQAGVPLGPTLRQGAVFRPRQVGISSYSTLDSVSLCLTAPIVFMDTRNIPTQPTMPMVTIEVFELYYSGGNAPLPDTANGPVLARTVTLTSDTLNATMTAPLRSGYLTIGGLDDSYLSSRSHVLTVRATGQVGWCTAAAPDPAAGGALQGIAPTASSSAVAWAGYLSEPPAGDPQGPYWRQQGQQLGIQLKGTGIW